MPLATIASVCLRRSLPRRSPARMLRNQAAPLPETKGLKNKKNPHHRTPTCRRIIPLNIRCRRSRKRRSEKGRLSSEQSESCRPQHRIQMHRGSRSISTQALIKSTRNHRLRLVHKARLRTQRFRKNPRPSRFPAFCGSEEFRNLDGIERRALQQLVARDPKRKAIL